jgi:hypothetical protein
LDKTLPIILLVNNTTGLNKVVKLFSPELTDVIIRSDSITNTYESILKDITENGLDCSCLKMFCKNNYEQHNQDVYIVSNGNKKLLDFNRCSVYGDKNWIGNITTSFRIDKYSHLEYSILSGSEVTLYFQQEKANK